MLSALLSLLLIVAGACSPSSGPAGALADMEPGEQGAVDVDQGAPGELVTPPFPVRQDTEGLLLVWIDAEGPHRASRRSDVPEAHRRYVRVESLRLAPDKRLDAEQVYVADLRNAAADGAYEVRIAARGWFESRAEAAVPAAAPDSGDVVLYMASWCGACKSAAKYMKQRDVAFQVKDIEKDPSAAAEMRRKAQSAGKRPTGVPVIDFRGEILLGFDRMALGRLIDKSG